MTKARPRMMKLGELLRPIGGHVAAWRHPAGQADGDIRPAHFIEAAQLAERGLMDFVFLADSSAVRGSDNLAALSRQAHVAGFEPLTLLSAIAAKTEHVGLIATTSTSFYQPYRVARQFASLDHISGGRAGWNLVTSTENVEARNFGMDALEGAEERYERAEEFIDVVKALWDSWDDDAFLRDKATGMFFDPDRVHTLNHRGKYYSVRGPLNIARAPQGHPVVFQAGSSGPGRALAARTADVVFTAQTQLADAQAFYADIKQRAAAFGREPGDIVIMPGLGLILGSTEQEAKRKLRDMDDLIHTDLAVTFLSVIMGGFDLSPYPVDGPLPFGDIPETQGHRSRQALLLDRARRENLTIRQLAVSAAQSYGHGLLVGTVEQAADRMEQWFAQGAADGFMLASPILPLSLEAVVAELVPELQRRGLYRRAYEGGTLRENLGLNAPASRYVTAGRLGPAQQRMPA